MVSGGCRPSDFLLKQFAAILGLKAGESSGRPRIVFDALPECSVSSAPVRAGPEAGIGLDI